MGGLPLGEAARIRFVGSFSIARCSCVGSAPRSAIWDPSGVRYVDVVRLLRRWCGCYVRPCMVGFGGWVWWLLNGQDGEAFFFFEARAVPKELSGLWTVMITARGVY